MGRKGTIAGIIIAIAIIFALVAYTNLFELAKPSLETSVDSAKEVLSQVEGKDVVKEAEKFTEQIRNATSKIEVKNPLAPNP